MEEKEIKKGEIVIYKTPQGPDLDVKLEKGTVWLTQKQIADLFGVNVPAVFKHVKNICKEGELDKNSTISKMEIVQKEAARDIKRNIDIFNLDMVVSVGYRINSKRATQFRIWATRTLKDYLIKGYVINKKRLLDSQKKLEEIQGTINFFIRLSFRQKSASL